MHERLVNESKIQKQDGFMIDKPSSEGRPALIILIWIPYRNKVLVSVQWFSSLIVLLYFKTVVKFLVIQKFKFPKFPSK